MSAQDSEERSMAKTIDEKVLENMSQMDRVSNLQKSINESLHYAINNPSTGLNGESCNINHEIFEMNEFYMDMVKRFRALRVKDEDEGDDDDGTTILSEVVTAIKNRRNDPEIKRQIDLILQQDEDIETTMNSLQNEKLNRQMVQNELSDLLESECGDDDCSKRLVELFRMESNPKKNRIDGNLKNKDTSPQDIMAKGDAHSYTTLDDNFIKRNIEAAKNTTSMAAVSLTDEEKTTLENLLLDVDTIQDCDLSNSTVIEDDSFTGHSDTPFRFNSTEEAILEELENKLKAVSRHNETTVTSLDAIDRNHREGKYWKIDQRLKAIENELKVFEAEAEAVDYKASCVDLRLLKAIDVEEVDDEDEMARRVLASYERQLALFSTDGGSEEESYVSGGASDAEDGEETLHVEGEGYDLDDDDDDDVTIGERYDAGTEDALMLENFAENDDDDEDK